MSWVTKHGEAALRLSRELMDAEGQKATALLFPPDYRFNFRRVSIRLLPRRDLIEFHGEALVAVPFVADKSVAITVTIAPRIDGRNVRLTYVSMRRSVSRCELTGPLCLMIKRMIDRHVGDGHDIQQFLDDGVNATLRPLFRAASDIPCERGRVQPRRIDTEHDFIEIVFAERREELQCLRGSDFFPGGFRGQSALEREPAEQREN